MATDRLEAGVVGAGTVSSTHMSALRDHPQARLSAICDIDEERARTRAAEYDTAAVFGIEELIDRDPDLIHVCTDVQTHFPLAKRVIEAGIPVLVEKPVTETVEEVEQLATLAEDHGVQASVIHQALFDPALTEVREKIRDGHVGEVRAVDLLHLGQTPPDAAERGEWVFDLPGGEFEEGLPHPIYMTLGVAGYPRGPDDVQAITSLVGDYDGDFAYDNAQIQYVTETGTLCNVQMSAHGKTQIMMHVHGTDGSLLIDKITQSVIDLPREYNRSSLTKALRNVEIAADYTTALFGNGKLLVDTVLNDDYETESRRTPHYRQIDEMIQAVRTGSAVPVPLEEAEWTLRLMQAIRDASTASERATAIQ